MRECVRVCVRAQQRRESVDVDKYRTQDTASVRSSDGEGEM
jgi:hypothetical protein